MGSPNRKTHRKNEMNMRKIFSQARRGTLPSDFDNWSLTDDRGRSVAHAAAAFGHLPAAFNQWEIASPSGYTVAHTAAINGHLPDDFNQWGLTDNGGLTVRNEHEYRRYTIETRK